jgi:hypothetical protein
MTKMKRAAAVALFFASATCLAQTVQKPEVKVEDRWVYRSTDRRMKPPTKVYEIRVTFVDPRAIHAVIEPLGGRNESDATWTAEWNSVVAPDEGVVEVEKGMFQFPLSPGRRYAAAWDMRRPRMGAFHVRHEYDVTVVGWEDIEVPAGRFRALKLEAQGHYRRLDRPATDEARNTYWYVPRVKRWVKHVYRDATLEVVEELYFYRVR